MIIIITTAGKKPHSNQHRLTRRGYHHLRGNGCRQRSVQSIFIIRIYLPPRPLSHSLLPSLSLSLSGEMIYVRTIIMRTMDGGDNKYVCARTQPDVIKA